jgi:hypothetical protein
MKARVIFTVACGLLLAAWSYVEWKQGIPADNFHAVIDSRVFKVGIVAAVVLAGFLVGRWWVVLAWVGPLVVLWSLQATGDFALGFDGATPTAFSTIFIESAFAMMMLLGVGLRRIWDDFRARPDGFGNPPAFKDLPPRG